MEQAIGKSPYVQPNVGGFISKISLNTRKKIFEKLMQITAPTSSTLVLDVGVTSDLREDSNFFEKLYPYPQNVTASGIEDASFLEQEFPGVKFVQADGINLPFPDNSFDLVVSFAVIEHVGSRSAQKAFIQELCRVGRTCCIATPNRWHPIEFHTILPLVHWLPPKWFRAISRTLGHDFYSKEENLNLLSDKDVLKLLPANTKANVHYFKFLGFTSNLLFHITKDKG